MVVKDLCRKGWDQGSLGTCYFHSALHAIVLSKDLLKLVLVELHTYIVNKEYGDKLDLFVNGDACLNVADWNDNDDKNMIERFMVMKFLYTFIVHESIVRDNVTDLNYATQHDFSKETNLDGGHAIDALELILSAIFKRIIKRKQFLYINKLQTLREHELATEEKVLLLYLKGEISPYLNIPATESSTKNALNCTNAQNIVNIFSIYAFAKMNALSYYNLEACTFSIYVPNNQSDNHSVTGLFCDDDKPKPYMIDSANVDKPMPYMIDSANVDGPTILAPVKWNDGLMFETTEPYETLFDNDKAKILDTIATSNSNNSVYTDLWNDTELRNNIIQWSQHLEYYNKITNVRLQRNLRSNDGICVAPCEIVQYVLFPSVAILVKRSAIEGLVLKKQIRNILQLVNSLSSSPSTQRTKKPRIEEQNTPKPQPPYKFYVLYTNPKRDIRGEINRNPALQFGELKKYYIVWNAGYPEAEDTNELNKRKMLVKMLAPNSAIGLMDCDEDGHIFLFPWDTPPSNSRINEKAPHDWIENFKQIVYEIASPEKLTVILGGHRKRGGRRARRAQT